MSYKFRDTAAAILFLAVLAVGVVYLALGFYWQDRLADGAGFLSAEKPSHKVKAEKSDASPVKRTDDRENKRNSVKHNVQNPSFQTE